MRVIFTRHGETIENATGIAQGQTVGGTLSEEGKRQATKLAERLKSEPLQYIYTSDLNRALKTAREVAKHHPQAEFRAVPELRERNLGVYEHGPSAVWKKALEDSKSSYHLFKPERGESYEELSLRVRAFFHTLHKAHPNDTLLVVSHGGVLAILYMYLLDRPINAETHFDVRAGNTAVTICDVDADGIVTMEVLNSTDHLN